MIQSGDPFCAVSTPAGTSGIAVIRISGHGVGELLNDSVKIIRSSGSYHKVSELPGYTCCFADFMDPDDGRVIDKVVITRFEEPYSYTGDEMIEISCHGSSEVKKEILNALSKLGIRSAGPGEFTKTAFMNGKMSLSSAEAVMDIISADSMESLRCANAISAGGLGSKLTKVEEALYEVMAKIEMAVDFDDEDGDTSDTEKEIADTLTAQEKVLSGLVMSFRQGRMLTERMKVAFTGIPNSGKSTLLNSIAGYERSIVTDISGTTTDTIEVNCDVLGVPVILTDTAGIRHTTNKIESMGVERAKKEYSVSDVVFYLVSPDTTVKEVSDQIHEIRQMARSGSEVIILFNKSDLGINRNEQEIRDTAARYGIDKFISISASEGTNVEEVRRAIREHYDLLGTGGSELIITSRRHYDVLSGALDRLHEAQEALNNRSGLDVVSSILRASLDLTGEITGKTVSADLAKTIFDKFCIGK